MQFKLNQVTGRARQRSIELPVFEFGSSIPRTIFQTNHARPWHPRIEANVADLQAVNAGWEHRFFDHEARLPYIEEHYGLEVLRLYSRIRPEYGAARADLFRYLVLYREGGVYLDMKSATSRPLDDVIRSDDMFLLSRWRNGPGEPYEGWGLHSDVRHLGGEFQQWFIAAAPGHPFLRAVIELVLSNIRSYVQGLHGSGAYAVLRVTGPVPYTLAISGLMDRHPHRLVDSASDLGLVYSVFDVGNARSHEALLPHYAKLTSPLVEMDAFHAGVSLAAGRAKVGLKSLKAAIASSGRRRR